MKIKPIGTLREGYLEIVHNFVHKTLVFNI